MATPTRISSRLYLTFFVIKNWIKSHPVQHCAVLLKERKLPTRLLSFPITFFISSMAASTEDNKALIEEVEKLYDAKDFAKMYDVLLPHASSTDADVLWRLARAATEKGKMLGGEDRKKHIYEAFEYVKKALELDDNNFACHKWYGILLDYTAEYEGNKQRISRAFEVKKEFQKAIELNPKDATSMYCLGLWCFMFANMPWYQRKIASVIFATPPTATYEEAMEHFQNAEAAEPDFYNQNKVMIGKTYIQLKENEKAKDILLKALHHEVKTTDDEEALKQTRDLLKSLGVKV